MVKIYETLNKIRRVSNRQPNSLVIPVPAEVRKIMKLHHGTEIIWEVIVTEPDQVELRLTKLEKQ